MEYIISRGHKIPNSKLKFEANFRFHLWQKKLWPYRELLIGDILYWYETPSKSIVWKSRVVDLDRFSYKDKNEVGQRLVARFQKFDKTQGYFLNAPKQGHCLALRVKAIKKVILKKPANLKFPQEGWMKTDNEIAKNWLSYQEPSDELTIDEIVPQGRIIERIHDLNEKMKGVSRKRVDSIVSQTLRNDTQIVKELKKLVGFKCQFPGCTVQIPKRKGGFYIEVAHVQPVKNGGRSIIGNLLVLCPNHHKEFDYGRLEVEFQTETSIQGSLNGKVFHILFPGTN